MSSGRALVSVCIVSHNSAQELPACMASVGRLSYRPLEIVVVDCASHDASPSVAARSAPDGLPFKLIRVEQNLGFAGGMNEALRESEGTFVLTLNPDARLSQDYVERLVLRAEHRSRHRIGAVTGRLRRFEGREDRDILDACGMRLTLSWRHLDRGSGRPDHGQFAVAERVFGATGAASLFRREALDDIAMAGEAFAGEFHSFREDAEICFRLRERGWEILYEPSALCDHRRMNLPGRRRMMPAEVNFHSLKNRYLLRAYHQDLANLLLSLGPSLFRDLIALVYVMTLERSSLSAYSWLWRHRQEILDRRRRLRKRRTCTWWQLNRWFFYRRLPL